MAIFLGKVYLGQTDEMSMSVRFDDTLKEMEKYFDEMAETREYVTAKLEAGRKERQESEQKLVA